MRVDLDRRRGEDGADFDRFLDHLAGEPDVETAAFLSGAAAALDSGPEDS